MPSCIHQTRLLLINNIAFVFDYYWVKIFLICLFLFLFRLISLLALEFDYLATLPKLLTNFSYPTALTSRRVRVASVNIISAAKNSTRIIDRVINTLREKRWKTPAGLNSPK